jgi:hypothetical protein
VRAGRRQHVQTLDLVVERYLALGIEIVDEIVDPLGSVGPTVVVTVRGTDIGDTPLIRCNRRSCPQPVASADRAAANSTTSEVRDVRAAVPARPLAVVMASELPKDSLKVAPAEDQHVVEALPACRPDPPLGEGVRLRAPDRRLDDFHPLGPEDLVQGTGALRVPVSDQEPNAPKPLPRRQVPGLPGDPRRVRAPGDDEDVHPAGPELDAEQHVEGAEPDHFPR